MDWITPLIILIIIEAAAIGVLIVELYNKNKQVKENTENHSLAEVEMLKLYSEFDFDKIDTKLDKLIDDAGTQYKIENFEYKNPEDVYITEEIMNTMIKFIVRTARKKITPAILSLIKLSYNIESETDLIQVLYERAKLYVLNYSIEMNAELG